jgi:hypothetical protein
MAIMKWLWASQYRDFKNKRKYKVFSYMGLSGIEIPDVGLIQLKHTEI